MSIMSVPLCEMWCALPVRNRKTMLDLNLTAESNRSGLTSTDSSHSILQYVGVTPNRYIGSRLVFPVWQWLT